MLWLPYFLILLRAYNLAHSRSLSFRVANVGDQSGDNADALLVVVG
ncbi:hypothetical protein [Helicobacter sp. L8]|nr:hypothetical protein [Helicobacter sp. L8]